MERKLFLLAFAASICISILFTIFTLDEILPSKSQSETILDLSTAYTGGRYSQHRVYLLTVSTGQEFEINEIEYFHLQKMDTIIVARTPIFNSPKGWRGHSFQDQHLLGMANPGEPRKSLIYMYLIALLFAFVSIKSKKFEIRVSIAFFLIILSAIKFWIYK
jgi:hypothetical protein